MGRQLQLVKNLHKEVWGLFDYKTDKRNYQIMEHWTSHADAVNMGETFSDDCDGYAFTCCELLINRGILQPRDVNFIVCETEYGEGHAVCGVDVEGRTMILDNRDRSVYDWELSPKGKAYKWLYFMSFDDPGQWKRVIV